MKGRPQKFSPTRLLSMAGFGLILIMQAGCSPPATAVRDLKEQPSTTISDLEQQLAQQFREQWPDKQFEQVKIAKFYRPNTDSSVYINVVIRWGLVANHSTEAGFPLYCISGNYCVGTLTFVPPAESGSLDTLTANIILRFR